MKKLILVHDLCQDPEGNKHPNHVRLICTKACRSVEHYRRTLEPRGEPDGVTFIDQLD